MDGWNGSNSIERPLRYGIDADRWFPWLVVAAGLVVYANSLDGVFVLDDQRYIVDNLRIRELSSLGEVLSHRRPVLDLSLAINYALGELEVRGYHVFNVLVHVLAALTLYALVRRTLLQGWVAQVFRPGGAIRNDESGTPPLKRWATRRASSYLALAVGLLWVVHPLQIQSVSYVIQRSESLMGLFYLLTLYCVIRGVDSPHRREWYFAAVASCALGMGSKAVMVTAPVVVLLYDRVFLSSSWVQTLRRRWMLYLGLATTWSVLVVCDVATGVLSTSNERATVGFSFRDITPLQYAFTQPGVILHYLLLSLWPGPLCLDYRWPVAGTALEIVPAALVILGLLVLMVWALVRRGWLGFIGAWFFLILAPTSSFIPIRDIAFEHRMYLPLASVIVLIVVGGYAILHRLLQRCPGSSPRLRWVATALVVVAVVTLGYSTVRRNRVYDSKLAMWQDVVANRPNNARAHDNLASALDAAGDREAATRAIRRSLQLDPQNAYALSNLGEALVDQGQIEEGIKHFRMALAIDPYHANANRNLGVTLAEQGRLDEAIVVFRRATRGLTLLADAHFNLGAVLFQKGLFDEAVQECRKALWIDRSRYEAHFNLGLALHAQGMPAEAVVSFREAVRLAPRNTRIRYVLGEGLMQLGKRGEAIAEFEQILAVEPGHTNARKALEALRN